MSETITIQSKSDLITSQKSKKTYFTIEDATQRKLICFNPSQYNDFVLGATLEVEVTPGREANDTPRVILVKSSEEPKPEASKRPDEAKPSMMAYEEFRYRSMACAYAKDLLIAGKIPEETRMLEYAEKIYRYIMKGEK